jgi:Beta/Gamma crystallin
MPPPHALAPPPVAQGTCQVTIFSEANFAGAGVPTTEEQPRLSESGWQNQIASIQVQCGTWDFYSDENFGGETMRLTAGPYPALPPEWTKRIGSFMCVQSGG